jgi:hypothetical protein
MDDCADLLIRAAQCRRLAASLVDNATMEALHTLAAELEDRAAIAATAHLQIPQALPDGRYTIARTHGGWQVSRGADRIVIRPTLEGARDEAQRLAAFDNAAE